MSATMKLYIIDTGKITVAQTGNLTFLKEVIINHIYCKELHYNSSTLSTRKAWRELCQQNCARKNAETQWLKWGNMKRTRYGAFVCSACRERGTEKRTVTNRKTHPKVIFLFVRSTSHTDLCFQLVSRSWVIIKTCNFDAEHETHPYRGRLRAQEGVPKRNTHIGCVLVDSMCTRRATNRKTHPKVVFLFVAYGFLLFKYIVSI